MPRRSVLLLLLCSLPALAGPRRPAIPAGHDIDLARPAVVLLGDSPSDLEQHAAGELRRYLYRLTGVLPELRRGGPPPAGKLSYRLALGALAAEVGEQGYRLRVSVGEPPRVEILAARPEGLLAGVYDLLERLGMGFYLGGDAFPPPGTPVRLPAGLDETRRPAFRVRGSLPWYNFLNSPTTWDLDDYRFFFDQMAKQRFNFVGFHSYDFEPFCAWPDAAGRLLDGQPLKSSLDYNWGLVRGLATSAFGFGTGDLFDRDPFSSRAHTDAANDKDSIRRSQALLAEALVYARRRGIQVCVGFELVGDPTDPATLRRLEARLKHQFETYPAITHVWFWQSEGLGGGSDPAAPDRPLGLLVDQHRPTFAYLKDERRIAEAARLAAYAHAAYRLAKRFRPEIEVLISGWGGDRWMRFSDFYLGLDKLLPKDVIFAALDNIQPPAEPNVSAVYGQLDPARRCWPIPWWESDGGGARSDQWASQANTRPFVELCRDALAKRCDGLLAIHWRTRGVEEQAAFCAQFAWQPELTYEAFYDRYARTCYGPAAGPAMARIHRELEALGPRWTGAQGQAECAGFGWFGNPDPEHLAKLTALREEMTALRPLVSGTGAERLDWMIRTADWCMAYDRAATVLRADAPAARRIAEARAAQPTDPAAARAKAAEAWALIRECGLDRAMQTYARTVSTQSEWGVLATINVKAYAAYLGTCETLAALGVPEAMPQPGTFPAPEPLLFVRQPGGERPAGEPFDVEAIALADAGIERVTVHWRPLGGTWRELPMQPAFRRSYRAEIPATTAAAAGLEWYLVARDRAGRAAVSPVGAPQVTWSVTLRERGAPEVWSPPAASPPTTLLGASLAFGPDGELTPAWRDEPRGWRWVEAHRAGVTLDETTLLGTAAAPPLVLAPPQPAPARILLVPVGWDASRGPATPLAYAPPPATLPATPANLRAESGVNRVMLSWDAVDKPHAAYRVWRDGQPVTLGRGTTLARYADLAVRDGAEHTYQVATVDRFGRQGERSAPIRAKPAQVVDAPLVWLPFDGDAEARLADGTRLPAQVRGTLSFEPGRQGQALRCGPGHVAYASREEFQLGEGFALSLWFRADSTAQIPLLATCGHWQQNGWFLQILGGTLRWYFGGGGIDLGRIEPGRWYHVAAVIDATESRLYLDGKRLGATRLDGVDWAPWPGELVIGQYCELGPQYEFNGLIDDLRLDRRLLSDAEVAAMAAR